MTSQLRAYLLAAALALAPVPAMAVELIPAETCTALFSKLQELRDQGNKFPPGDLFHHLVAAMVTTVEQKLTEEGIYWKCALVLVFP